MSSDSSDPIDTIQSKGFATGRLFILDESKTSVELYVKMRQVLFLRERNVLK